MNAEKVLDALVGAKAKPSTEDKVPERSRGFLEEALRAFGLGRDDSPTAPRGTVAQGLGEPSHASAGDYFFHEALRIPQ